MDLILEFLRWFFIVMTAIGAIYATATVGKPRVPMTGGFAAVNMVFSVALIVLLLHCR